MQMLWNWYTVDACFLSTSWRINNDGAFAATCIGVVLLVVALEVLRPFRDVDPAEDTFEARSYLAVQSAGDEEMAWTSQAMTAERARAASGPPGARRAGEDGGELASVPLFRGRPANSRHSRALRRA